ncbi:response regulator transcription factor [Gracilibacillus ureilyticus]|uniref:response regulator transcription factor n=1 Tax=Gracilibacillus ureilyticus TaxID=531814 RepID=UPI001FE0BC9E|nr:response regulator [Gracilibacillus ureilyticus]
MMVVDDERRTRQGIVTLIEWKRFGFEVIDTAADGLEAIEKYKKHLPHLVIIDIKMPKMSGLEVIKIIREKDQNVKFLILSGYADFHYAKQALQYNATGYLLKPLEEEELTNYLMKIHKELDEQNIFNKEKENNHCQSHVDNIIQGVLTQKSVLYFEENLKWEHYALLLLKFHEKKDFALRDIYQNTQGMVKGDKGIVFLKDNHIGILVNENKSGSNTEKLYYTIYHQLTMKSIEVIAAVSEVVSKIESLNKCYRQAIFFLEKSFFYEEQYLITSTTPQIFDRRIKEERGEITNYQDKLLYAIEISDKSVFIKFIKDTVAMLAKSGASEKEIKSQITMTLTYINNKLTARYPQFQEEITNILADLADIQNSRNVKQLISSVHEHLIELSSVIDISESNLIVKRMTDFIDNNYANNIKLDMIAELLHYHKAYLGKLFKEETGEYFKTYLDKVRIENSKRYLKEGYKVYEVAKMVGYTTADYFHSKFKKYEGISPSDYRKK